MRWFDCERVKKDMINRSNGKLRMCTYMLLMYTVFNHSNTIYSRKFYSKTINHFVLFNFRIFALKNYSAICDLKFYIYIHQTEMVNWKNS